MKNYKNIINKFSQKNILVIGDVILDQYIRGSVSRISPEAPVPVVLQEEAFFTPGGAANVAQNLRSLGAEVILVGRIGEDSEGEIFKKELQRRKISTRGIVVDSKLPTITKTRIMAQNHQIVRIDKEKCGESASKAGSQKVINYIKRHLTDFDAVIISDYGKGLITPDLIHLICACAQAENKIVMVDPKVENFGYYQGVTAITPNLKEAENAIRNIKITSTSAHRLNIHNDKLKTDSDIDLAGKELLNYLDLDSLLITLGEHGMRLFERGKKPFSIKTKAQEVFDVSGAGDTVISVFTLSLAAGATKKEAADLANSAAGIVVGKMGAVAITKKELVEAVR
ncbi:ADP-heptose synthase / D-glycero-beta-D-manno-heptose 7-phosphate kinase [hydrothermal vent metagenome]|uniref:ADP-heptose synthase / D-glycero-beta-D-manno-heptose 7-phosphate kinase n=1 Tax=hydrothermal vent metagenome TaxID=652676 RepID=A0A3B1D009_9ZZZZ